MTPTRGCRRPRRQWVSPRNRSNVRSNTSNGWLSKKTGAEPLDVYLVELTSVTVAATQGLARVLRNRAGNYLLVLTDDYDRLDFVLLERTLPAPPTTAMATRQVSVRPRILTINRRTITQNSVQLRVLRRFTYTEADSDAQYEKLLSAYTIAEWSEPLFNNRALFSDYYLNQRLPDRPEWQERPESAYQSLKELLSTARRCNSPAKSCWSLPSRHWDSL